MPRPGTFQLHLLEATPNLRASATLQANLPSSKLDSSRHSCSLIRSLSITPKEQLRYIYSAKQKNSCSVIPSVCTTTSREVRHCRYLLLALRSAPTSDHRLPNFTAPAVLLIRKPILQVTKGVVISLRI